MVGFYSFAVFFAFIGFTWAFSKPWVVFPGPGSTYEQCIAIEDKLHEFAGKDHVYTSESKYIGHLYWWADLTDDQKSQIDKMSGVFHVGRPLEHPQDPDDSKDPSIGHGFHERMKLRSERARRALRKDQTKAPQLRLYSKNPGEQVGNSRDWEYRYDESAGAGSHVFIVDSGLDIGHPEFDDIRSNVKWIQAGPFNDQKEDDSWTHGTTMASVAVGKTCGVAPKAALHVVRCQQPGIEPGKTSPEYWLDGVAKIYDYIRDNKLAGKAVINLSIGSDGMESDPKYKEAIVALWTVFINHLADDAETKTPAFVAAGNEWIGNRDITDHPALLAKPNPDGSVPSPGLTVVAGVRIGGDDDEAYRRNDFVKLNGLSDDNRAAVPGGSYDDHIDGTSPATAGMTGLAAYLIGTGMTALEARDKLISLSYTDKPDREDKFPKHGYNGARV